MQQALPTVQITPEAHLVQSFWKFPGAPLGVHVNTMVLTSREPVLFDTGVAANEEGWLAAVSQIVDPADVRWVVLSHDDHDHVGNLTAALEHFPNAMLVASWWIMERLTGSVDLDPRRMRWVVSGETLDIGDRTLVFERPPLFDSPTTRAVFDPSSGLYWSGDLGAALSPEPVVYADEIPPDDLKEIFCIAHRWISPWYEMLDEKLFQAAVTRLEQLGITTWAQTHGPVYHQEQVSDAIALLRTIPSGPSIPQPGQAELDALVLSMISMAEPQEMTAGAQA